MSIKTSFVQNKKLFFALITATCLSSVSPSAFATTSCPGAVGGVITVTDIDTYGCDLQANQSIQVNSGASIFDYNFPGINMNSVVSNGTINVEGTVDGGEGGIRIIHSEIGSITNTGIIRGFDASWSNAHGIYLLDSEVNGSITNDGGTISSNIHNGINLNDSYIDGYIRNINGGVINGASYGIYVENVSSFGDGIENDATSTISGAGGIVFNISSVGSISNYGLIKGTTHSAILIENNSTVNAISNHEDARIVSDNNKGILVYGAEVSEINNQGSIESYENGVSIEDGSIISSSITNDGTITSTNGAAIYIHNSTVANITNTGTLEGDTYAIYVNNPISHVTIDNTGTLIGAVKINNSTLNLNSGSVLTNMGEITGDSDSTLNFNTNYTTSHGYSLGAINIGTGVVLSNIDSNTFDVSEVFQNSGTFSILNNDIVTIDGNYSQLTSGILKIQLDSPTTYGKLVVTDSATFASNAKINVDVTNSSANIATGNVFSSVITSSDLNATTFNVTDNSVLFDFIAQINGNNVDLLIGTNANNSVSQSNTNQGNTPGAGAAKALDNIIAANDSGNADIINALGSLTSDEQIANAVSQTLPAITGGTTTAMMSTMDTVSKVIQAKQETNSGLSSGDEFATSNNIWLKPFGSWANQDNKKGVIGYDADSYGMIGGTDISVSDTLRLGGAISYANTSLESNNSLQSLDVDSYQAIFYGSQSLRKDTEVNFQADLGYGNSDSTRRINFGGLNLIAKSKYDSWSGHAGVGVGHTLEISDKAKIIPSIRTDYFIVKNDSYSETGAGGLNLNVGSQTSDQLIPAVDGKFNYDLVKDFSVSANAGLGYNVLNDKNSITSSYVGGGGAFITNGLEPSPWIVRSGAGLTYKQSDKLDLTARYDREDRGSDFDNQTVSIKARMLF